MPNVDNPGSFYIRRIDDGTVVPEDVPTSDVVSMIKTMVEWYMLEHPVVGAKGEPGEQGIQGLSGPPGATGIKGDTGSQGPQGITGTIGSAGPKGDTGSVGPQGVKGDTGLQGIQGVKGDTGLTGNPGATGSAGVNSFLDGKSAIIPAATLLATGTREITVVWNKTLPNNTYSVTFLTDNTLSLGTPYTYAVKSGSKTTTQFVLQYTNNSILTLGSGVIHCIATP